VNISPQTPRYGYIEDFPSAGDFVFKPQFVAPSADAATQPQNLYKAAYAREHGLGIARDLSVAVELYTRSAQAGFAPAQLRLGTMYANGIGVPENRREGARLWKLAADQGDPDAQLAMGDAYSYGYGVSTDYAQAAKFYRSAADKDHPLAQYKLAKAFETGQGVPTSMVEANNWYSFAAAQGNMYAEYEVGMKLLGGAGLKQDESAALELLRKSAGKGYKPSQDALLERGVDWNDAVAQKMWEYPTKTLSTGGQQQR
jgi:TPR repeat protein